MNARDLSSCLDLVESELRTLSGVDCYAVNLYQPAENSLVCARLHLPDEYANMEEAFSQYSLPLESGDASTIAIQTGKPVLISAKNLSEFSERTQAGFIHGKMKCLAVLPIRPNGADQPCTGTIVLISLRKALPAAMLDKVGKFMAEAAPILQLHQRAASLEARNYSIRLAEKELQSLLHFISEMTNLTTEEELYPRIEQEFLNRFELDFAAILIAEGGVLRCADTLFFPEDVPWGGGWRTHCQKISYLIDRRDAASSNALINNRPFYFGNIPALRDLPMGTLDRTNLDILQDLKTFAIQPIRNCGKPVGILWLGSMHSLNALSAEQLRLIQQLCDFLGGIIENARRYGAFCAQQSDAPAAVRKAGKAARQS